MPRYEFACEPCGSRFDARRPVPARDDAPCPACGRTARRVFTPRAVMIQTPAHLAHIRADFEPLATAAKSSNYLAGKVLAEHVDGMHAAQEKAAKSHVPFEKFFRDRNPGVDLNQPLTATETRAVKQALGAPHGG